MGHSKQYEINKYAWITIRLENLFFVFFAFVVFDDSEHNNGDHRLMDVLSRYSEY